MRIFLVRHADADAEIPEGLGDEARTLNAKSRIAIHNHFLAVAERMQGVNLIITSPLVRAVQTAQILSFAIKHEGSLKAHRSLLPDMPVGTIDPVLNSHTGETLVLVGHQPSMGAMASHLLGMQSFPKPVSPGTIIAIEKPEEENAPARLLFYAAPGQPVLDSIAP